MDKDNLNRFGTEFQINVIAGLVYDTKFLQQIYDIILADFFESESRNWIVTSILKYYKEYKKSPSLSILNVECERESNDLLKIDIKSKLDEILTHKDNPDIKYVQDNFIEFCRGQNFKKALYGSIEDLKNGNFENIKEKINNAYRAGLSRDIGIDLLEQDVEHVLENLMRNTIPTPWETINEITENGFAGGELIIFVGAPGTGKSWLLTALGLNALKLGKTVVHYTLELSEHSVIRRYYSILTGIEGIDLKYNIDEIKHKLSKLININGKLIIKGYPTKRATIETLDAHIEHLKTQNIFPDIIVVDYGDLMASQKFYREKRLEIGNIFEELRGLSGTHNIPVITGTQSNRAGSKADIIEGDHVSEDFSKIMIGDFIISISRKIEDSVSKTARFFIIKNRFGPDKFSLPATFNVNNGHCEIYAPNTLQAKNTNQTMRDNGDTRIKSLLKEKYFK